MSIAIVVMVRQDSQAYAILDNDLAFSNRSSTVRHTENGGIIRNHTDNSSGGVFRIAESEQEGEFSWSLAEQGFILGSFFWGYLLMGIPGGLLAQKYGGKWVISVGLLLTAILTLLIPLSARAGLVWIITVRALQGMAEVSANISNSDPK